MVRVLDRAAAIEGLAYLLVMGLGAIILVRGVREPPPRVPGAPDAGSTRILTPGRTADRIGTP